MTKDVFILDLDGTLYYQLPVRIMMAAELVFHYLFHPTTIKELLVILSYRKAHENTTFDINAFSKNHSFSPQKVQEIIQYWMIERPLKWLYVFSDKKLIKLLKNEQVFIFSDYPTQKKLNAIHFHAKDQFFYGDGNVHFMKPNPDGLVLIQKKYNLQKNNMIFIGDRLKKDGLCAKNFGCRYIILSSLPLFRYFQYRKIKDALKS